MLILFKSINVFCTNRRVYLSVAAAAIYMASQASDVKKTQKGSHKGERARRERAAGMGQNEKRGDTGTEWRALSVLYNV